MLACYIFLFGCILQYHFGQLVAVTGYRGLCYGDMDDGKRPAHVTGAQTVVTRHRTEKQDNTHADIDFWYIDIFIQHSTIQ